MPRHGDNIHRTESGRWEVRFKLKETGADGVVRWRDVRRSFDARADAEIFRSEVRLAASRGEVWRDERDAPAPKVATLGEIADAYLAALAAGGPATSARVRGSRLRSYLAWAGRDTPVSSLSTAHLDAYAASLPSDGRRAVTRHRKILQVEAVWAWAARRGDRFPGTPPASQVTGDTVRAPPPVVRLDVPSWAEVDRAYWSTPPQWRPAVLVLRCTGLRASQVLGLRWSDVRLDYPAGAYLVARAGVEGAKAGRTRALPLAPTLADALRASERSGEYLVGEHTAGSLRRVLRAAWADAGVAREKWDRDGYRGNGSPCHAIRAAFKVGLLRAGVAEHLADYLVGHARTATHAAYVPEAAPETSPYWAALVDAVARVPPLGTP